MDFRCVCGHVLSMDVAPGTVVRCPACGQTIQAPGAPPGHAPAGPPVAPAGGLAGPIPYPAYPGTVGRRTSGLATAAFVLGLVSLLLGPLTGVVALILGIVALIKIGRSEQRLAGTGLAVAGLILGAVLSVGYTILLLPALARAQEAARQVSCANNLRQLGFGVTNYATDNGGLMPPGDLNVYYYMAPYTGNSEVYQCGSHPWLPGVNKHLHSSYAFNVSLDERSNEDKSPFSTTRGRYPVAKHYSGSPADTIVAIEMWMRPKGDGTFPNELRLGDPDWSPIDAGVVPLSTYDATTGAQFDARGRLVDPGPYRFLDCYKGTDVPVSRMYHSGKINVLFVDGHVTAVDIRELTSTPPTQNPRWTGLLD